MKPQKKLPRPSNPTQEDPRGRILAIKQTDTGKNQVVIDNGPVNTITIHCYTETLAELLAEDPAKLRAHLMTRMPGHFRRKKKR
jgi:hypothetical protein